MARPDRTLVEPIQPKAASHDRLLAARKAGATKASITPKFERPQWGLAAIQRPVGLNVVRALDATIPHDELNLALEQVDAT